MDFFSSKIYIIKKKLDNLGLYDVRLVVLVMVGAIAVSVFWNGAKIIQQNYELTQKVVQIQQENEVLELENRNKELRNQYLATDEFAELTARRVLGKASPGESVYIVPENVALASLTTQLEKTDDQLIESDKPKYLQNLESWLNIYFGN
jgi:cell division protein FtsB